MTWAAFGSIGAASNNQTVSYQITYGQEGAAGSNSAFAAYNVNSANINFSTTGLTAFTGTKALDIPLATSLAPGHYAIAIQRSTANSNTGLANLSNASMNMTAIMVSQLNAQANLFGNSSASTNGHWLGGGVWTTNTNGRTSASMAFSHISTTANQPIFAFELIHRA